MVGNPSRSSPTCTHALCVSSTSQPRSTAPASQASRLAGGHVLLRRTVTRTVGSGGRGVTVSGAPVAKGGEGQPSSDKTAPGTPKAPVTSLPPVPGPPRAPGSPGGGAP